MMWNVNIRDKRWDMRDKINNERLKMEMRDEVGEKWWEMRDENWEIRDERKEMRWDERWGISLRMRD